MTKLCECGCGRPAPIAAKTDNSRGYVKGQPRRFIHGHQATGQQYARKSRRIRLVDTGYKTPCHIWQLALTPKGYGQEWNPRLQRMDFAHLVAWEKRHGPIPAGLEIHHLCNARACRNVSHLAAVTHADHMKLDDIGRGRRLSAKTVNRIHDMIALGLTQAEVARAVGVSQQSVSRVVRGVR